MKKLDTKIKFTFEELEEFPELNFEITAIKKQNRKQIKVQTKKPRRQKTQDASIKLF